MFPFLVATTNIAALNPAAEGEQSTRVKNYPVATFIKLK
jgi:hypothetical protein